MRRRARHVAPPRHAFPAKGAREAGLWRRHPPTAHVALTVALCHVLGPHTPVRIDPWASVRAQCVGACVRTRVCRVHMLAPRPRPAHPRASQDAGCLHMRTHAVGALPREERAAAGAMWCGVCTITGRRRRDCCRGSTRTAAYWQAKTPQGRGGQSQRCKSPAPPGRCAPAPAALLSREVSLDAPRSGHSVLSS